MVTTSQPKRKNAPNKRFAANRSIWFCVLNSILVRLGTASPTKAIGPQKAVIKPVKTAVTKTISIRNFFTSYPISRTSSSPRTRMFKGLTIKMVNKQVKINTIQMIGSC